MGFFSKLGARFKRTVSKLATPFRRDRPEPSPSSTPSAPAPQAPRPSAQPQAQPQAPRGPAIADSFDSGRDSAREKRIAERREQQERERKAREEANRKQHEAGFIEGVQNLSPDDYARTAASDYEISAAEYGSKPWQAAQLYLESEGLANLNARQHIVKSGKNRGKSIQRPSINKTDAIDNASGWFKKMDNTGTLWTWKEERSDGRGGKKIVEIRGLSSAAYLASVGPRYHSGAPDFFQLWDKLGSSIGADTEIMPYRGIW